MALNDSGRCWASLCWLVLTVEPIGLGVGLVVLRQGMTMHNGDSRLMNIRLWVLCFCGMVPWLIYWLSVAAMLLASGWFLVMDEEGSGQSIQFALFLQCRWLSVPMVGCEAWVVLPWLRRLGGKWRSLERGSTEGNTSMGWFLIDSAVVGYFFPQAAFCYYLLLFSCK